MSKRKPATKRARSPKIASRAHRNKQALVRSAKESVLRSVAAGPVESAPEVRDAAKQPAPVVEKQSASSADNRTEALKTGLNQTVSDYKSDKGIGFPSAANIVGYQAKLMEIAQANMQLTFEFGMRLAAIRSPFEYFEVIAEFTTRRINLFGKHRRAIAAHS